MTLEEVIERLEDIKSHCEDMTVSGMSCDIWRKDAVALDHAIKIIKKEMVARTIKKSPGLQS